MHDQKVNTEISDVTSAGGKNVMSAQYAGKVEAPFCVRYGNLAGGAK